MKEFLRMTNPDYTRRAHYDPLDDKLVLGNSLFEEDANIWQVPNLGVSLSKTGGSREFGPGSLKIHAQSDEIIRLETIKALDASQFESIEYAFSLTPPQPNKNKKKKKFTD